MKISKNTLYFTLVVSNVYALSGFQDYFLQPIIKDRSKNTKINLSVKTNDIGFMCEMYRPQIH